MWTLGGFKILHHFLFGNDTVHRPCELRKNLNNGAAQPDDEPAGQNMVVSEEHMAMQVRNIIETREKWLKANDLPMSALVGEKQKQSFLDACMQDFHNEPKQKFQQQRDAQAGKGKAHFVNQRMKSRWARHLQLLAGIPQMWHALSSTGRFDPDVVNNLHESTETIERTKKQRQDTSLAVEARARLREAMSYARQREQIETWIEAPGGAPQPAALTRRQT